MSASKSKKEKDKNFEIKEQIEYYLSDENLKKDSFFHQKISEDPNGYIELDFILKCNKCKKAGWTKDEIKEALKLSDKLEITGDKVRRKNNKTLPELVLLSKKRKKEDEKIEEREPIILMFTCKESNKSN